MKLERNNAHFPVKGLKLLAESIKSKYNAPKIHLRILTLGWHSGSVVSHAPPPNRISSR